MNGYKVQVFRNGKWRELPRRPVYSSYEEAFAAQAATEGKTRIMMMVGRTYIRPQQACNQ